MKTVAEILKNKPDAEVHTVTPDCSVYQAIKTMAEHGIGAIVVVEDDRVVGMFTERDYARKIILQERASSTTQVRDVMSTTVYYAQPSDTSEYCMALMSDRRFRHLPVLENGKLVGVVSMGDLVKDIIGEQRFIIQELERYISGEHV
ncbi:CBS domain-containing protein [Bordetella sp. 2513F-2]